MKIIPTINISFFDKSILRHFSYIFSVTATFISIVFLFVELDSVYKLIVGGIVLGSYLVIYIALWAYANFRNELVLQINKTEIVVRFGDIFEEREGLKVIAFNEYFDTIVDNNLISETSLNGQYIKRKYGKRIAELDEIISQDNYLRRVSLGNITDKFSGKTMKYPLGTVCEVNGYLLVALTHFDKNNKAYLSVDEYISALLNFWNEIDRVYAGRTIKTPLLGSGITRFSKYETITDQELLEILIWTFKISRIKMTYSSRVEIILYKQKKENINLLKLRDLEG
jgi:hypothetical protein